MKIYLFGKIVHVTNSYLILDHNGEGELIYVPNASRFIKDEVKKIFISNVINEYNKTTYGFDCFKELVIFEDLIALQGIGPKTAISILNYGWENILSFIAEGNKEKLSEIPFVSAKLANNIIFAYRDKYHKFLTKMDSEDLTKIKNQNNLSKYQSQFEETMKMLGFKTQQIKLAMNQIDINENIEKCVENAIKLIGQMQNETRV
ncbi:Holliday junction branch migration protein RuvA [Metamycoplasma neophronis]|uniref:Holliday junction branch migration complex subunit RuvA n=1 Tax=Metamycoplasma neophronis TaxID=872983 RepID=A0ABY2Z109_9BACT|nr:Holliday junction branch migration protein RuvA [Metamycoplasma neophronis]TPR54088.1 Holliday junction branch migration protein RuvA [Metamycoplasma neophronis]